MGGVYRLTIAILQGMKCLWISTVFHFGWSESLIWVNGFQIVLSFQTCQINNTRLTCVTYSMCFLLTRKVWFRSQEDCFSIFFEKATQQKTHDIVQSKNMWNSDFIWACDLKIPTPKSIGSSLYLESFGLTTFGGWEIISYRTVIFVSNLVTSPSHSSKELELPLHVGRHMNSPAIRCQVCAKFCWWLYWMLGRLLQQIYNVYPGLINPMVV